MVTTDVICRVLVVLSEAIKISKARRLSEGLHLFICKPTSSREEEYLVIERKYIAQKLSKKFHRKINNAHVSEAIRIVLRYIMDLDRGYYESGKRNDLIMFLSERKCVPLGYEDRLQVLITLKPFLESYFREFLKPRSDAIILPLNSKVEIDDKIIAFEFLGDVCYKLLWTSEKSRETV